MKRLSELAIGETARVSSLAVCGGIRRRFLDVGMTPGTKIVCVGVSPLGDPHLFLVRGVRIAIRASDAYGVILD